MTCRMRSKFEDANRMILAIHRSSTCAGGRDAIAGRSVVGSQIIQPG